MSWKPSYGALLFASVLITYVSALLLERSDGGKKKALLTLCIVLNMGLLVFFKYSGFLVDNLNAFAARLGRGNISALDIVLPVGISFYTFQAVGYTIDVFRKKIKAERDFFKYALFVSFFPQLVAGPIERSSHLLPQFDEKHDFDIENVRYGLLTMLWGLFIKMVIADRISLIVTDVHENYLSYNGMSIFLAILLFTLQIYCDFSGYSYIAIGSARVMGFKLCDNFHHPLLSSSIHEFWKNWHISLTGWFTDYVYIPLGGNRKGKLRKELNTLFVFLISGFWHGAGWTYALWGLVNGIYMVFEDVTKSVRKKISERLGIDTSKASCRLAGGIWTYLLVSLAFFAFRADSFSAMIGMLRQAKALPGVSTVFGQAADSLCAAGGMDHAAVIAFVMAVFVLFVVDMQQKKGKDVQSLVLSQGKFLRWLVYLVLLFMIMLFGVYGNEYEQTQFIYFQF